MISTYCTSKSPNQDGEVKVKMLVRFTIALFAFGVLAACSTTSSTPAPAPTSVPVTTKPDATSIPSSPVLTAAPAATNTGAQVPSSCSAIVSLVGAYTGGVATTKSLGSPQHLSCEFANANASNIVIVNIGVGGTVAAFDTLRATSAQGGRTVTSISGLGASAFSVSKNNVPAGVSVLTAQGLVYVVNSNLPIARDEALIEQLMKLS
jgi:hypothetical protein